MKEYVIMQRCRNGTPFMLHFFNDIVSAKIKLYDMISLEEERGRIYFVDNDFFNNKYSFSFNGMYYCIKVREVTEFVKYTESTECSKEKNNIYFFNDYKKIN